MQRRRFAVIGMGSFGFHLTRSLFEKGHDVLAVDSDPERLEAVRPFCSHTCLADVSASDEMEKAGVSAADVGVVAIGSAMDASILATLFLKEQGVREIVAKADTAEHARILTRIGASEVVHPERDMAERLAERLVAPDVLERLPFLEDHALVELRVPSALWGRTLAESGLRSEHGLAVVLVKRPDQGAQAAAPPRGDQVLRQGDVLVVLARVEDVEAFRRIHSR